MNELAPSRGDQTRQALVTAATRIIGRTGFDAASTRAIAEAAGANLALINYHFGGKAGLYEAVIESIANAVEKDLLPLADQISSTLPLSPGEAREAMIDMAAGIIGQFSREELADWSRIIAREQQDPTPGFEVIYGRVMSPVLNILSELVTCASSGTITGESARLRAIFLIGQILVFTYAPAAAVRFLDWPSLGKQELEVFVEQLRLVINAQFAEV